MYSYRYISTESLKEILKELDNQLTSEDLEGIIDEVDADGSGTVDFDGELIIKSCIEIGGCFSEFVQMMTG